MPIDFSGLGRFLAVCAVIVATVGGLIGYGIAKFF